MLSAATLYPTTADIALFSPVKQEITLPFPAPEASSMTTPLIRSRSLPTTHPSDDDQNTTSSSSQTISDPKKASRRPDETAMITALMEKLREKESDATIAAEIGQLLLREVNSLKQCLVQANSTAAEFKAENRREYHETDSNSIASVVDEKNHSTSLVRNLVNDFEALQQTASCFIGRDDRQPSICGREKLGGGVLPTQPFGKPRKMFPRKILNTSRTVAHDGMSAEMEHDVVVCDVDRYKRTLEIAGPFPSDPSPFKTYQHPDINADVALAAEIGQSLLFQTRNLQARVAALEQENSTLRERHGESLREARLAKNAAKRGEENEARAHERVWSLELQKQELHNQLTQLQRSLAKTAVDNNRQTQLLAMATEQVETLKASEERLNTTIEKIRAKHGQESCSYRRTLAGLVTERLENGMSKEGDNYLSAPKVSKYRRSNLEKIEACDLEEEEMTIGGKDNNITASNIAVSESRDSEVRKMCGFDLPGAISQARPEQAEEGCCTVLQDTIESITKTAIPLDHCSSSLSMSPRRRCATPMTSPKLRQRHRMRGTFSGSARRRRKSITPVLTAPRRGLFEELEIASGTPMKPYRREPSFADVDLSPFLASATPLTVSPPEEGIRYCPVPVPSVASPADKVDLPGSSMANGAVATEFSQENAEGDPFAVIVKQDASLNQISTNAEDIESFTDTREISLKVDVAPKPIPGWNCEKIPVEDDSVSPSLERVANVDGNNHKLLSVPTGTSSSSPQRTRTDPATIAAITETMIGELLYKYTRSRIGSGNKISDNRHLRFFWVHPYTRTVYWRKVHQQNCEPEVNLPTGPKIAAAMACVAGEQRAKSAYILSLRVVDGLGSENPSIVLRTRDRELKIKACSFDRHEVWFKALSFLVSRQLFSVPESSTTGDSNGEAAEEKQMKLCPTIAASTACTVEMTANSKKRHTEAKRKIFGNEEPKESDVSLTGSVKRRQPSSRCDETRNPNTASALPTPKMCIGERSPVSSCLSDHNVREKNSRRSASSTKSRFLSALLGNSTVSPQVNRRNSSVQKSVMDKSSFPGMTRKSSVSGGGVFSTDTTAKRLRPANQLHLHRIFETVLAEAKSKPTDGQA